MEKNWKQNKAAYDMRYAKENIVRKHIPFNKKVPEDARILEWLDRQGRGKVVQYIKDLILDDMRKAGA